MTTRPNLGRQPSQRSLSSTNVLQRPPPHRTLSQQFSSASPSRRTSDNFVDLTFDGDTAPVRPRIGTSRLRVEISKDSNNSDTIESPKRTPDAPLLWKPSVPPRGRPQLHFDVPSVSNPGLRPTQEGGQHEAPIKPMPLPVRPGQHAPPISDKLRQTPATVPKKDARPKPYVLEVPTAAPRYYPTGHADFFPWTGNHPEDQFSEPIIRGGYFDKSQMTQNETGSARSTMFPALKHKSGLQTLSSIFTSVLAQRRAHGQVTAASTFKPPPRVTVTDTKREMWLKDLANPTISLRRLSRSIPHGIRGKVLLDQSLSKNIPIERAAWLAKCVGANELRSFRRKGVTGTFAMGGEAKWIRDFTVCVEQFVEGIVSSCGEKDFKTRINYAIRLATHFYSEYLLDREHYMDWIVTSLEICSQAKLPMWLLVTQVYWKDLLQYRKYGRRLSAALMNQLVETLDHPDHDILAPLSDRLEVLLKGLILSNSDSFVASKAWTNHRDTILSKVGYGDERFMLVLNSIDHRNSQLTASGIGKEPTIQQRFISLLDETLSGPYTTDMAHTLWQMDDDKDMLIQTLIQWSTSSHRPGHAKIYVAARVIRSWAKFGIDVTDAVLCLFDLDVLETNCDHTSFFQLVSELARSEHFSTPRYIQWLIARGGISRGSDVASNGPCSTRLLAELPTHNLSHSIEDLRLTLLTRADISFEHENNEKVVSDYMALMEKSLPGMQTDSCIELESYGATEIDLPATIVTLSRTIKSEIGLWLRQKVKLQMVQPTIPLLDDWDVSSMKRGTSAITGTDFNTVRRYLEIIEDYSMLADVLKLVTSSNDPEVLASCADTLDLHLEIFSAIGALKPLFDILMGRLRTLTEEIDSVPRNLLVSLLDLSSRLPEQKLVAQQLAQELARSDRKTAADACSPISDHMAIIQTAELGFIEEIEKVLASGNSMDQATCERLFQRIILRLEASWDKSVEQQRSCNLLLTRLRTFEPQQFDVLMITWVKHILQMQERPSMILTFVPLISLGCLSLHDIVGACSSIGKESNLSHESSISQEAMVVLMCRLENSTNMTIEEEYRFRVKQAHMQKDNPIETLSVICRAIQEHPSDIKPILERQTTIQVLQYLVITRTAAVIDNLVKPLLQSAVPEAVSIINEVVDKLLLSCHPGGDITAEALLNVADDLSLPFCQVKLSSMFSIGDAMMEGAEESTSNSLEAFDKVIEAAVVAGKKTWSSIVALLDISVARHLRQRAEIQFLALLPSPKTPTADVLSMLQKNVADAENLLHIVDATAYSIDTTGTANNTTLTSSLVTVLNSLWVHISSSQLQEVKDIIMIRWLPLLLSLTVIHISSFDSTKAGHESRAKVILALTAITLQLRSLDSGTTQINSLAEQTYDLTLCLVDGLSEEMRLQCIRTLRDNVSTPKMCYLFSFAPNPTDWLVLSQKEKLPSSANNSEKGPEPQKEKLAPFALRRWELLGEPTPNVGENDTSLSLTLFGARRR